MIYYKFPCPSAKSYKLAFPSQLDRTDGQVPLGFFRRLQTNEKRMTSLTWVLATRQAYIDFVAAYKAHRAGVPFLIDLITDADEVVAHKGIFVGATFAMSSLGPGKFSVSATVEVMPYES